MDSTHRLMDQAGMDADDAAIDALFQRYRARLARMVSVRMDPRLSRRVDPSDIVQDALLEASRKLPAYLESRPVPFYVWLRSITWERLVHTQAWHIQTQKRSVTREQRWGDGAATDPSLHRLSGQFVDAAGSPSGAAYRQEVRQRVRSALEQLGWRDREVLALRYLEQLSTAETADVLGLSVAGVKSRHLRALRRLQAVLSDPAGVEP